MKAVGLLFLVLFRIAEAKGASDNCTIDACLREVLPVYPRSNVPLPALYNCISWQQTLSTETATVYSTLPADVTTFLGGCPSPNATATVSTSISYEEPAPDVTGSASTTCTEETTAIIQVVPTSYADCNAAQFSSVCECISIYPFSPVTTETAQGYAWVTYITTSYVGCSDEASPMTTSSSIAGGSAPPFAPTPSAPPGDWNASSSSCAEGSTISIPSGLGSSSSTVPLATGTGGPGPDSSTPPLYPNSTFASSVLSQSSSVPISLPTGTGGSGSASSVAPLFPNSTSSSAGWGESSSSSAPLITGTGSSSSGPLSPASPLYPNSTFSSPTWNETSSRAIPLITGTGTGGQGPLSSSLPLYPNSTFASPTWSESSSRSIPWIPLITGTRSSGPLSPMSPLHPNSSSTAPIPWNETSSSSIPLTTGTGGPPGPESSITPLYPNSTSATTPTSNETSTAPPSGTGTGGSPGAESSATPLYSNSTLSAAPTWSETSSTVGPLWTDTSSPGPVSWSSSPWWTNSSGTSPTGIWNASSTNSIPTSAFAGAYGTLPWNVTSTIIVTSAPTSAHPYGFLPPLPSSTKPSLNESSSRASSTPTLLPLSSNSTVGSPVFESSSSSPYGYGTTPLPAQSTNSTLGYPVFGTPSSSPPAYGGPSSPPWPTNSTLGSPVFTTGSSSSSLSSPTETSLSSIGIGYGAVQSSFTILTGYGTPTFDSFGDSTASSSIYTLKPTSNPEVYCIPSALNASWVTSGYQAVYAADYSGCYMNPLDETNAFQLYETATNNPIVNVNGIAAIAQDQTAFADAYYTFERQENSECGVLDIKFHWQGEESYLAVYGDGFEVGFERNSSASQVSTSDYTTSIWSMACDGTLRAGKIGAEEFTFATGAVSKTLHSYDTTFIAPGKRRSIRRKTHTGTVQFKVVVIPRPVVKKE